MLLTTTTRNLSRSWEITHDCWGKNLGETNRSQRFCYYDASFSYQSWSHMVTCIKSLKYGQYLRSKLQKRNFLFLLINIQEFLFSTIEYSQIFSKQYSQQNCMSLTIRLSEFAWEMAYPVSFSYLHDQESPSFYGEFHFDCIAWV